MLLSSCPGGNISNLFTKIVRGNVALSVALTSTSSLLSVLTVPVVLKFSEYYFLDNSVLFLDLKGLALRAFLLTAMPVVLGISIRHLAPTLADRVGRILTKVAIGLLLMIIAGAVIGNWGAFIENLWLLGASMSTLFFLIALICFLLPLSFGVDLSEAKAISIEVCVQNGAFGITVAALLMQASTGFNDYSLASAIYGIIVYFAICPVILFYRNLKIRLNQKA